MGQRLSVGAAYLGGDLAAGFYSCPKLSWTSAIPRGYLFKKNFF